MKVFLLFAILVVLAPVSHAQHKTKSDFDEKYKEDLVEQGATPEDLALLETIYNSTRPTLVCLCHHEPNVTTCGVDGHLYLNECAARCRHVEIACVGETCGDCSQYGPHGAEEEPSSAPSKEAPEKKDEMDMEDTPPRGGRRFLFT